ncbi:MAG: hypothetical protein R6W06_04170 [Prochlorococcaceae cyanobacterium]
MNRYELALCNGGSLPEVIARSAFLARSEHGLDSLEPALAALSQPVCSVFAPLLTAFCAWVVSECRRRKIRHLFFLARDGQVFQKIIDRLQPDAADLSLHYLYVSRRSLQLPVLELADGPPAWML